MSADVIMFLFERNHGPGGAELHSAPFPRDLGAPHFKDFRLTENSIEGVDWKSSSTSAPSNIEGVTAPTLIATMGCHYCSRRVDLRARKTSSMWRSRAPPTMFTPCRPEYGNTKKRLFAFVMRRARRDMSMSNADRTFERRRIPSAFSTTDRDQ